jgi:hypothetical protein
VRPFALATTLIFAPVGLLTAEEFYALVSKVDKNTVTVKRLVRKGQRSEPITLPLMEGARFSKGKFNKGTKTLEPSNEPFDQQAARNLVEKQATLALLLTVTEGGKLKVREIRFFPQTRGKGN